MGSPIFLCKVSASRWGLVGMSTQICSTMGRVHNEAWQTSADVFSWRNVSSLAESLISRWSQLCLLGYLYIRKRSQCLKLNFNWQIPKCDWLVYYLCANINYWQNRFGCSCKQGLSCWLRPCVGRWASPDMSGISASFASKQHVTVFWHVR